MATTEEMDKMYRWTRYVYDFTRKYYLLGRDRLLREMELQPGDRVLEIGCGTARNLVRLARQRPDIRCYGLDASNEMLATAAGNVKFYGLEQRITLKHCLAEELQYEKTFELNSPFDAAFFSYSLSMIPTWTQARCAVLRCRFLGPGWLAALVPLGDQALARPLSRPLSSRVARVSARTRRQWCGHADD
jgi:S-adenosylmethionine-diacylgycerolhomoserine-N-methlytransferase